MRLDYYELASIYGEDRALIDIVGRREMSIIISRYHRIGLHRANARRKMADANITGHGAAALLSIFDAGKVTNYFSL